MSIVGIGIIIVLFAVFAIITWIAIIYFSKEEEEEIDAPIVINFMAGLSEGKAVGIEHSSEVGKNNRRIISMSARDVRIKDIQQIPIVKIIADNNHTVTLPKGTWSRDKNINIYLPPSAKDFPEPLKQTPFGRMLMLFTEMTNADNAEIEAFREGMKRQKSHIIKMGAGEVSIEHLNQVTELFSETLDSIKDAKKDKGDTGGFSPARFGQGGVGGAP